MRHLLTILAALALCSAAYGQTMKSLMFNATNGQVVANTSTNPLKFSNTVTVFALKTSDGGNSVGENSLRISSSNSEVFGDYSIIVGGRVNLAHIGDYQIIVGGENNNIATEGASADYSIIVGGKNNAVEYPFSAIVSGSNNAVSGPYSFIGGGFGNRLQGQWGFIGGGQSNQISQGTDGSVIPGGFDNFTLENYSFAGGARAGAEHQASFVWNSGNPSNGYFVSAGDYTFNVRAEGGMSLDLGTNGIIFRTNASAAATRTNLGLGWSALTNSNAATALLGLNTNNQVVANIGTNIIAFTNAVGFAGLLINENGVFFDGATNGISLATSDILVGGASVFSWSSDQLVTYVPIEFSSNSAATTRTNLGLGGGITTNRTFVAGGVTNSVTISNGIITGWTQ